MVTPLLRLKYVVRVIFCALLTYSVSAEGGNIVKHNDTFPKTINGISYQSQEELNYRMRTDAEALGHLE